MGQRIFVNVVGFADEERHALNLLFRISEEQGTAFMLWEPNAPEAARLAIIDGQSYQAQVELESPRNAAIPIFWVGDGAPQRAARTFARPISWPEVVRAMDELFPAPLDFDIDLDNVDTQPPASPPPPADRRVLIAAASLEERLYVRAKLSLAGLTHADEATSAAEALELARANDYVLAVVDFGLAGMDAWAFLRDLAGGVRRVPKLIVTVDHPTLFDRLRARFAGITGFFEKPPHPGKLHRLLRQV
jgi:CheY-like chemotaxis protein